jgi:hypothetical protein
VTLASLAAVALVVVSPADANCQPSGSNAECFFDTPGTSTWTVPDGVTQATSRSSAQPVKPAPALWAGWGARRQGECDVLCDPR